MYIRMNDVSQLVHFILDPVRACKEQALGDQRGQPAIVYCASNLDLRALIDQGGLD